MGSAGPGDPDAKEPDDPVDGDAVPPHPGPTDLRAAGTLPAGPLAGAGAPTRPTIGRFQVLDVLGSGGMGTVFAAYDPKLERRVAIKMLHEEISGSRTARLEREARGMAQLSHPNVVAVYETGTVDERLFIVMELVEGQTLSSWCRAERRGRAEILELLIQAGRGLAAAHDVGLVHRDFKPANVLVGKDGRARVADFGLVAEHGERGAAGAGATGSAGPLTATGAVMGTPVYMAPEQHSGQPADTLADQFSFAVSAWEALCDERPYSAHTYEQLVADVNAGRVRPVPPGVRLPARLRAILTRSLSADPTARFASMHELLAALERSRRRPRTALIAGAIGALAIAVVAVALGTTTELDRCGGGAARIATVWSPARRAALAPVFAVAGQPAATLLNQLSSNVDRYARSWAERHRAICQTSQRSEQSPGLLDLRMHCLDRRLLDLDALLDRLEAGPDRASLFKAVDASATPLELADCDRVERLGQLIPRPTDPVVRAKIAAQEAALATARSLTQLGRYGDALELAAPAATAAAALGYPPLEAEAVLLRAELESHTGAYPAAEESYRAAAEAAARARDDGAISQSWSELMRVHVEQSRYDDALALVPVARAAAERVSDDVGLSARFHNNLGRIFQGQHKFPDALAELERALALQRTLGDANPQLAQALLSYGMVLSVTDPKAGRAMIEEASRRFVDTFGELNSGRAFAERHLAYLAMMDEDPDSAIRHSETAIEIWQTLDGPDAQDIPLGLDGLGAALLAKGDIARGRAAWARALAIREARSPGNPSIAVTRRLIDSIDADEGDLATLPALRARLLAQIDATAADLDKAHTFELIATIETRLGHRKAAIDAARRSLKHRIAMVGEDGAEAADSYVHLGEAQLAAGQLADAEASVRRAIAIRRKALGGTHAFTIDAESQIGDVRVGQRRFAEALSIYRRTAASATSAGVAKPLVDKIRFGEARALYASGRTAEGRALAVELRDGTDSTQLRSEMDAWLRSRSRSR
jgi:tetratricopeptide (TPR) repeat protein